MIDVIIPCYEAQSTLHRCLSSIGMQTYLDSCKITICVDGEDTDLYENIVNPFRSFMNIEILKTPEHVGSGYCRNYGIENTSNSYIIFVDADDTLHDAYSIQLLRDNIGDNDICSGSYMQETKDSTFLVRNDFTCLHGKLYSREFIDKYSLRFHNSKLDEDSSFNWLCRCFTNKIIQIDNLAYSYMYNANSLVSISTVGAYDYYTEAMIWALKEAEVRSFDSASSKFQIIFCLYSISKELLAKDDMIAYESIIKNINVFYKEAVEAIVDNDLDFNAAYNSLSNFPVPKEELRLFIEQLKEDKIKV